MQTQSTVQPGALIAGRYRVIAHVGHGTAGSVYRAFDDVLGQEVAVKILGEAVASDTACLTRFLDEVRTARQITHPNVVRIHDLGEDSGLHFLTMEFVDGQDLGTLLRRAGRISGNKAIEIAQQICAGLHAAHKQGMLHRNLKPENVLIDGAGNVRLVDFGIHGLREEAEGEQALANPRYQAPEVLAGAEQSLAGEVFSLGLILHELFTGKPVFPDGSLGDLMRAHRRPIAPLSDLGVDVDPRVQDVVTRCLQRDPKRRPQSVLEVLGALPGSDPLRLALASGDTPSPDMVAAAGGSGRMHPGYAVGLLLLLVGCLPFLLSVESDVKLLHANPLPHSGEVLAFRARGLLGSPAEGAREAFGFMLPPSPEYGEEPRFWYRQGDALVPRNIKGRVDPWDPPAERRGTLEALFDIEGTLLELRAFPLPGGRPGPLVQEEGWRRLLTAAGEDPKQLEEVDSQVIPFGYADQRRAWRTADGRHIEVAALHGKPVVYRVRERMPLLHEPPMRAPSWRYLARAFLLIAAAVIAWQNLKRRRGDLSGALQLAVAILLGVVLFTVLTGDRLAGWGGVGSLLLKGLSHGLGVAMESALYYFALETHARRIWPETMIGWSRLMKGRFLDPLVARDVLIGFSLGAAVAALHALRVVIPGWFGADNLDAFFFHPSAPETLSGLGSTLGVVVEITIDLLRESMKIFMALVLLRVLLRSQILAGVASALIWSLVYSRGGLMVENFGLWLLAWAMSISMNAAQIVVLMRFGILPLVVGYVTFGVLVAVPLPTDLDVWYAYTTLLILGAILLQAALAAYHATRPRSIG